MAASPLIIYFTLYFPEIFLPFRKAFTTRQESFHAPIGKLSHPDRKAFTPSQESFHDQS